MMCMTSSCPVGRGFGFVGHGSAVHSNSFCILHWAKAGIEAMITGRRWDMMSAHLLGICRGRHINGHELHAVFPHFGSWNYAEAGLSKIDIIFAMIVSICRGRQMSTWPWQAKGIVTVAGATFNPLGTDYSVLSFLGFELTSTFAKSGK